MIPARLSVWFFQLTGSQAIEKQWGSDGWSQSWATMDLIGYKMLWQRRERQARQSQNADVLIQLQWGRKKIASRMSPDGFTLLKLSRENQESPANYIFLIDSRRAVTDVCTLKGSWTLCSSNLIWKMTSVLVTPAHIFPGLLLPLLPVWRGDTDSVSCLRLLETNGSFLLQFWKCRMKGCRAIHLLHRSNEVGKGAERKS